MPKTPLHEYHQKRDFEKTKEPIGSVKEQSNKLTFVVQQHAASHLHYDFRLEFEGVLLSWAIPKGPSLNPADKRLAIKTEDHPIEYATFEGTIPEGSYGAGTVMVWDTGTYHSTKTHDGKPVPFKECLRKGTVEIFLEGKKLQGGFALIKMQHPRTSNSDDQWLLIKMSDEYATTTIDITKTEPRSVLTGRTMHQIAKGDNE